MREWATRTVFLILLRISPLNVSHFDQPILADSYLCSVTIDSFQAVAQPRLPLVSNSLISNSHLTITSHSSSFSPCPYRVALKFLPEYSQQFPPAFLRSTRSPLANGRGRSFHPSRLVLSMP